MITKYFTKVVVKFNPLGPDGRNARIFLSMIPPSLKGSCTIEHEVLTPLSKNKPIVKVTFKDKQTLEIDPTSHHMGELSQFFDRHSRLLQTKESIESS